MHACMHVILVYLFVCLLFIVSIYGYLYIDFLLLVFGV